MSEKITALDFDKVERLLKNGDENVLVCDYVEVTVKRYSNCNRYCFCSPFKNSALYSIKDISFDVFEIMDWGKELPKIGSALILKNIRAKLDSKGKVVLFANGAKIAFSDY